MRGALAPGRFPGTPLGEGWGRMFVTAQVGRWARGQAPWGRADLLAWPEGMPFWPTDPLVQAVQVPLAAAVGDTAALTLVTALVLTLAGVGPHVLARVLGARPLPAAAAGVAVQLSPFVLRHGADLVMEALALGPAALAGAAVVHLRAAPKPGVGSWAGLFLAVLACAATSPYYAVYLAITVGLVALWDRRQGRRWAGVAAAGALACALPLLPLRWVEGGSHGRLGPELGAEGYRVSPTEVRLPSGARAPPRRPPREEGAPGELAAPPPAGGRGPAAPPPPSAALARLAQRAPGGATLLLAALAALAAPRSRPTALLALLLLLLSPEPWNAAAALVPALPRTDGPLAFLLEHLPLGASLGNAGRLVGAFVLLAAVAAARLATGRPWLAALLVLAAAGEARLRFHGLALPSTLAPPSTAILEGLPGATVFFPSGDPPAWHPEVAPKEVLFLAGRAGVPVAYDYGRARTPADLAVLGRLSTVADVPIGVVALRTAPPLPDDATAWGALPFTALVVLEDRLDPHQRAALLTWLEQHATLVRREGGWSHWTWPQAFQGAGH